MNKLSNKLSLVGHQHADQIVAWQGTRAIPLAQFLADVNTVKNQLPNSQHIFNMCADRYHFAVGLAAAIVTGRISLLPSTHTPDMVRQMQVFAPDVFCLHDLVHCEIDLPKFQFPELSANATTIDSAIGSSINIPQIDSAQLVAIVFTSGSTGTPVPHHKYWGTLQCSVLAEAKRIGLPQEPNSGTIIGTVPAQHMYGLESSVLLALQSGLALSSKQPFYPADIVCALESVPAPRILVSTPVHMRMLLEAKVDIPEVALILSATAPLSLALAQELEQQLNAPLQEIYGSTETGTIATRRPTQTDAWHLFDEVELIQQDGQTFSTGGQALGKVVMNDVIELKQDKRFLLQGRTADLINIAGRRSSITHLNHQL
ncbi:MAG: acyl-CoA synthetase, partial [Polaromonas sp.]|nr:acyl-CoA synthetase [Polaromonas sp.]